MVKQRRPVVTPKPRTVKEPDDTIYLREWLNALGLKQGKVAAEADLNPGYVSQLVNREKYPAERPRIATVRRLAGVMDMPWHLLYELPPSGSLAMADIQKYPHELLKRLSVAAGQKTA